MDDPFGERPRYLAIKEEQQYVLRLLYAAGWTSVAIELDTFYKIFLDDYWDNHFRQGLPGTLPLAVMSDKLDSVRALIPEGTVPAAPPELTRFSVTGELEHFDDIARVVGSGGRTMALLDVDLAGDVHVDLVSASERGRAGRVPDDEAEALSEDLLAIAGGGFLAVMTPDIYGGTPDKPRYGIWLSELRSVTRDRLSEMLED